MSLTDLKKSKDDNNKKKKKAFSVDDFISDAENYAKGTPQLVSQTRGKSVELPQALAAAKELSEQKDKQTKPFRHATFTLSETAIAQLQELAQETQLAKSHIIRILINELCAEEQQAKLTKLLDSKIN